MFDRALHMPAEAVGSGMHGNEPANSSAVTQLFTVAEAAELEQCSERHIYRLIAEGVIRPEADPDSREMRVPFEELSLAARERHEQRKRRVAILTHLRDEETKKPSPDAMEFAGMTAAARARYALRAETVRKFNAFADAHPNMSRSKAVAYFCGEHGIHPSQLWRWLKNAEDGRIEDRRFAMRGHMVEPAVLAQYQALYLRQSRPSRSKCYVLVQQWAAEQGYPCPSQKTLDRALDRAIPACDQAWLRDGPKRWADKYGPYVSRTTEGLAPNAWWVSDHHQFDVFVWNGRRAVRPWITAWMDVRSRLLVGWTIHENPNSDQVLAAFARGCVAYGVPTTIYTDNGKDYRAGTVSGGRSKSPASMEWDSARARPVTERLGIDVVFAKPYNARAKPIERAFREVEDGFAKFLPGYCGCSAEHKPDNLKREIRDPEKNLLSMDVFAQRFSEWLISSFHQQRHPERKNLTKAEVFALELREKRTAPEELLRLLMLPSRLVMVSRGRVKFNGYEYSAPELEHRGGERVELRYDPDDVSSVLVLDREGRRICTALSVRLAGYGAVPADEVRAQRAAENRLRRLEQEVAGLRVEADIGIARDIARRAAGSVQPEQQASARVIRLVPSPNPSPAPQPADGGTVLDIRAALARRDAALAELASGSSSDINRPMDEDVRRAEALAALAAL